MELDKQIIMRRIHQMKILYKNKMKWYSSNKYDNSKSNDFTNKYNIYNISKFIYYNDYD